MAEPEQHEGEQDLEKKIEETRLRFKNEFLQDATEKYDSKDVERLQKDDALVEGYLQWRIYVVDDALKMIDESFQWRKEYGVNDLTESTIPRWMFETGALYLHGYDKEGNKLFWFKVKLHVKDAKTVVDKKRYVAFWLERYAKKEPGMPLTVVFDMAESGLSNIDPFKYSYPPLPDDDFQTPICENGPIVSEDETEIKEAEMEGKDALESSFHSQMAVKPKKVNFLEDGVRADDNDKGDTSAKTKGARKPLTTFKGPLLDVR
ncbi:Motile sperm domain-containing protein 2 [Liparis tanakae]|uniref:Motile sperm domain-containing protein 2 n=1 Tax=Liparis tanakae TaxID=230148 RepID=A0A4Z2GF64_9TELE|nr:Motile sperm domain-containing protein 2 [Liparis tanakae]